MTATDNSIFKPALMLMSGRAVAFTLTFFVPAVLVRIFNPTEFGTYKQLFLIAYTLYPFVQLGFAECLYYFIPSSPQNAAKYAANSVLMLAAAGTVCGISLMVFAQPIANKLNNPALVGYMPLIALYLVLLMISTVLEVTMLTRKRYRWATGVYAGSDFMRAALLMGPAIVMQSLTWALIGSIAFCLLRLLGTGYYLRKEFGSELGFDGGLLRRQVLYSAPYSLAVLVEIIQANYHQFAVSSHFDVATFAIYSVGCLQIPLVDFMASPLCNVMMVRMAEELREGRVAQTLSIWHDGSRRLALIFFPMVGLLLINARPLITLLFTDAFAASAPIFMLWSLSFGFSAFQTTGILRTFNQTRFIFWTNLVRLIAIASMMSWFLTTFHLIGAVLVTLIGIVVAKAMALVRMRALMQTSLSKVLPWKNLGAILIIAMLSALLPIVLMAKMNLPALYLLPISGALYMIVYTVMVLSLGVLTPPERRTLATYVWNSRNYFSRRAASGS